MIPIYCDWIDGHRAQWIESIDAFDIAIIESVEHPDVMKQFSGTRHQFRDYNYCCITANAQTFHCVNHRVMQWHVVYNPCRNFNISVPVKPAYLRTVYDALAPLLSLDPSLAYPTLPDADYAAIGLLPSGWRVGYLRDWYKVPPEVPDYVRLNWYLPCDLKADQVPVHPTFNRPCTSDEMIALFADTSHAWLQEQVKLYCDDFWKGQNFESVYDDVSDSWHGRHLPPESTVKRFDLYNFSPDEYYPYQSKLPDKKWNVDSGGKLIQSWNFIEQAYYQTKAIEHVPIS